jgi:hypothetical protein
MRQTLGAIIAVAVLGTGCASLQDTRMYNGRFGRTEVGAVVIASDPGASKVLVETYDGDLWIYDVDPSVSNRLSTLRVGDEVTLAFDDRIGGKRAIALSLIAPGRRPLAPGMPTVAEMLPAGVVFGAPAVSPAVGVTGAGGTFVATDQGTGFVPAGTVVSGGSTFVGVPAFGAGVIAPGFGSFSALPAGVVSAQTAFGLGLAPASVSTLAPMGGPSLPGTGGTPLPGRSPFTQSNFSPGTVSPGVTTANPNAPGSPVVQGPFTPGTLAPGVSQQRGNAPPAAAGANSTGAPRQTMTRGTPAITAAPVVNGQSIPLGTAVPPGMTTIPGTTTVPGQTTIPGQATVPGQTAVPGQPTVPGQTTTPQGQPVPQGQAVTPQGQPAPRGGTTTSPQGGTTTPQGGAPRGGMAPAGGAPAGGGAPRSN